MIHAKCDFVDLDSCQQPLSSSAEYYLHKTGMFLFEFVPCGTTQNVHRQYGSLTPPPRGAARPAESWSRALALYFRYWLSQRQHQGLFSIAPLPRPLTFGLLGDGGAQNHKLMPVMK